MKISTISAIPNAQSKPKLLFYFVGFWKHISQPLICIIKYWMPYDSTQMCTV